MYACQSQGRTRTQERDRWISAKHIKFCHYVDKGILTQLNLGVFQKKKTQSKIKTDCAFQVEKWILRVLLFRVKLNKTKAEHSATADHWKLCLHGKGHRAAHPTEHLLFFQPPDKTNWKWKLSHIKENSGLVPFLDKSTTSIFFNHKFTKKTLCSMKRFYFDRKF